MPWKEIRGASLLLTLASYGWAARIFLTLGGNTLINQEKESIQPCSVDHHQPKADLTRSSSPSVELTLGPRSPSWDPPPQAEGKGSGTSYIVSVKRKSKKK